jgi:hypothetical protein
VAEKRRCGENAVAVFVFAARLEQSRHCRIQEKPMAGVASRRKLVARLWRAVEAEITAIEARLGQAGSSNAAHEEGTKQLGLLARLIRDLAALDEQKPLKPRPASATEAEDASAYSDLVSQRAALEKRLEALAAREED